jgi:hypothetical protein
MNPPAWLRAPTNCGLHLVHGRTTLGARQNFSERRDISCGGGEPNGTVGLDHETQPIAYLQVQPGSDRPWNRNLAFAGNRRLAHGRLTLIAILYLR